MRYVQLCRAVAIQILCRTGVILKGLTEKIMRYRAFTYMSIAVEKIRKCGKSVFWKDPEHAAYYASAYMRKQRRKAEKAKSAQTAPVKEMATV